MLFVISDKHEAIEGVRGRKNLISEPSDEPCYVSFNDAYAMEPGYCIW